MWLIYTNSGAHNLREQLPYQAYDTTFSVTGRFVHMRKVLVITRSW